MHIIYDDFYLKHDTGTSHPENPGRLVAIKNALDSYGSREELSFTTPVPAEVKKISLVHSGKYIEKIKSCSENDALYYLDPDTVVSKHTYACALLAAGGCLSGVDLILNDSGKSHESFFFALVRPPGHHAFRAKGTGFCIFNNVAISAMHAISRYDLDRIAIIDFDVHHGNGTQNIFYESEKVFYISLHQYPHYPGTGYLDETGSGRGEGFNLNIPMQPFSGEVDYTQAFVDLIIPVLSRFRPELILVSAGFDGHAQDPLSCIGLRDGSYYKMMHSILYISRCQVNHRGDDGCSVGIVLEGGYSYKALAGSVLKVIDACLEKDVQKSLKDSSALIDFLKADRQGTAKAIPENIENFKKIKSNFGI